MTDFGAWVKHPLYIGPASSHPEFVRMMNDSLAWKKERIREAIRAGDWSQVIWLHERPWRPDVLSRQIPRDWEGFWALAGSVWTDTEFPYLRASLWRELFSDPAAATMMDEDEREEYERLGEEFTVYRGALAGANEEGLSWTLDRDRAEWFSRRWEGTVPGKPVVLERVTTKERAIALLSRRGEREILVPTGAP